MANRHTPEHAELLPSYAMGALDGPDLEALEAHLAEGCPECLRELARWRTDLEALAATLPPVTPSDTTRARLMRSLDDEGAATAPARSEPPAAPPAARPIPPAAPPSVRPITPSEKVHPRRPWTWLPIAAALALVVGSGFGYWTARREATRLAAERDRAVAQAAALDRELATARAEGRRLARALEVISAPGMRPIALAALEGRSGAGRTFLDPESRRAVFVASGLPQLPRDRDYELWFIADGKPVAAGVFDVDAAGNARLEVRDVVPPEQIDAWAVTIEPAGGVPQPTGEAVLSS